MTASTLQIYSALNYIMNVILICCCHSQVLELSHISNYSLLIHVLQFYPIFWWQYMNVLHFVCLYL